jgi:hypothetical protein
MGAPMITPVDRLFEAHLTVARRQWCCDSRAARRRPELSVDHESSNLDRLDRYGIDTVDHDKAVAEMAGQTGAG